MSNDTGKGRAQRIEIDYFRKKDGLTRWRLLCILIGLGAAVAYGIYVMAVPGGANHVSTGPLSTAHQHFETDCAKCHQNLTPMDTDAKNLDLQLVGVSSQASLEHTEAACQSCHRMGDHFRDLLDADWVKHDQDCATCHKEHLGSRNDLLAISDQSCNKCHADLNAACANAPKVKDNVVAFSKDSHGEFAFLSSDDPGRVRFDHAQHLQLGQAEPGDPSSGEAGDRTPLKLSSIPTSDRERYRKLVDGVLQTDDDFAMLNCNDCHQPTDPSAPSRSFAPINFEEHCQACHAIGGGLRVKDATPLPHAVTWEEMELHASALIVGARSSGASKPAGSGAAAMPGPASAKSQPIRFSSVNEQEKRSALQRIRGECLKCHDEPDIETESIKAAYDGLGKEMIPTQWLAHGYYDHAAHASIKCSECHGQVYELGDSISPDDHKHVMIKGIESCTGCHRAKDVAVSDETAEKHLDIYGGMPVTAPDNCTLCHRYHSTDEVRQLAIKDAQKAPTAVAQP